MLLLTIMSTYIIGDLHGYHEHYVRLLQEAGLCDNNQNWTGGEHQLWLIGDLFDRGQSGIKCLDITRKLQQQAGESGGLVQCLLGNHELMILCAYRFGDELTREGRPVSDLWLSWGGVPQDLADFTENHALWIENLPAMARIGNALLLHADSMIYINYGLAVEEVNTAFKELMQSRDLKAWETALASFAEHMAFSGLEITGKQRAKQVLRLYGGEILIHGHTPIPYAQGSSPEKVTSPWVYAGGMCINVDGGIYLGSPGFIYELAN